MKEVSHPDEVAEVAEIKYFSYGMAITHNMPCAVDNGNVAVYDMNANVFQPSWEAQKQGWAVVKERDTYLSVALRWLFGRFLYDYHSKG